MNIKEELQAAQGAITRALELLAAEPKPRARVVPMVPCNWPDSTIVPGQTYYQSVLAGLRSWASIASEVIVLTRAGNAGLYPSLVGAVPQRRIIPGITAHSVMSRIDDRAGWARLEKAIGAIRREHECTQFALDFEEILRAYVAGDQDIKPSDVAVLVQMLPSDLEYIIYPSTFWFRDYPFGVDRLTQLWQPFEAQRRVCWIAQNFARPDLVGDGRIEYANTKLMEFAKLVPAELLWFYDKPSNWQPSQIVDVLEQIRSHNAETVAYIYPGNGNFEAASAAIVEALKGAE